MTPGKVTITSGNDTIKTRFASGNLKTEREMKFFNTIPGDGEVAILLYGDVGDGQKVDSGRVVSELMALQA